MGVCFHKFKYISCYSLSLDSTYSTYRMGNLNTSHVILYRDMEEIITERQTNLNTSHVILYRNIRSPVKESVHI